MLFYRKKKDYCFLKRFQFKQYHFDIKAIKEFYITLISFTLFDMLNI